MLGSLPMSLNELPMAPALISSVVQSLGHKFKFLDINLRLFHMCNSDHVLYEQKAEWLQDVNNYHVPDAVTDYWYRDIVNQIKNVDVLLINVFSVFRQAVALRLCQLTREHYPKTTILLGGIGSHKKLLGGLNQYNTEWAHQAFTALDNEIFGQVLLDNHLVDDWQPNVGTDIINKWLPGLPSTGRVPSMDFACYSLDQYQWHSGDRSIPLLGSHGCVRQCSFCDVIKHFPKYSFVEADQLTQDIIQAWNQTGIHRVQFMDSLVNGSMSNFLLLLKNLAHARQQGWLPQEFSWSGTYICRPPSSLLDQIHEYLAPSGADNMVIGVETGSDRVRFEMEKKFTNQDLLCELQAFRKHGVKASGLFFPSWPTETPQDFQNTLDLFASIAEFAQSGTLESVSLGTTGFGLIDGTPIDLNKDRIGLEQGPLGFLWRCNLNPELTFWETIRRRLTMARWCELHGLKLDQENTFRRFLLFNLQQHQQIISDYSGALPAMIDVDRDFQNLVQHHVLAFDVINSGTTAVTVTMHTNTASCQQLCAPGITSVRLEFDKTLTSADHIKIEFEFVKNYATEWAQYPSGDYYDTQGVYLDNIWLDSRNITYWGWNQLVDAQLADVLPMDYHAHKNLRCVTAGMSFDIEIPSSIGLHQRLQQRLHPELEAERLGIDQRISAQLRKFML